ncbi:terminase TerL endonuclease subunit [Leuconostoc gelidum]|uniref:terminase TerL endonuclease subunit n=1 Tax=Leuconostoc gelidum TaxID=1244 RepID=UPI001C7D55FB|nr:terminase TerL endonuclease subunit [Leuconostoc gelidum]MBZ6011241.1 terminase large subunit [Leuconostoc gelidum subsp. aenigmaticum]
MNDYADVIEKYGADEPSIEYCLKVLNGEIIAGEKIKFAVKRHLNDLQKTIRDDNYEYVYKTKLVDKILKFSSLLKDVSTGENFKLVSFQKFILSQLVGWWHVDGTVKYKYSYISMGRSQGKSQVLSVYLMYQLLFAKGVSKDIGLGSIDTEHTKVLYRYMSYNFERLEKGMFKSLFKELGVEFNKQEMRTTATSSVLNRFSAKSTPTDSRHFTTFVLDEAMLLTTKDKDWLDSVTSGQTGLPNSQFIAITTAQSNPQSRIFFERYQEYEKAIKLNNFSAYERDLVLIWQQDSDDEMLTDDYSLWQKSNPLLELESIKNSRISGLKIERQKNINSGSSEFMVKSMNRFVLNGATDESFTTPELIEKAKVKKIPFDEVIENVYVGLDLSKTGDNTAISMLYVTPDGHYYIRSYTFVPTYQQDHDISKKSDHDNIDYLQAEKSGRAYISTGSGIVDEDEVINWLVNHIQKLQEKYSVTFLYDSWGVDYIADSIDKTLPDLVMLPVKQTTPYMSQPSIFTQQLLVENKLHFVADDNILESALLNARTTKNDYGIKVVKDTYSNKIDNLYSTLIAMFEAQYALKDYTNNKDDNFFAGMSQQEIDNYYKEYKF